MNHSFLASQLDRAICNTCKRDYLSHTVLAVCEACGAKENCDIFGSPSNPKAMLLCISCTRKEESANDVILVKTQVSIIEKSREIDQSIRYNGDFFNAETIAISQLKKELDDNNDLSVDAKAHKLHELVMERIEGFKKRIVEIDNEKHELVAKQQAGIKSLRELGNAVREEIRERLKQSDANYTAAKVIITPKLTKPRLDPFERLVEAYSLVHDVSKDDARAFLRKGKAEGTA